GEIRVGVEPELIELRLERVVRVEDALPRNALFVARTAAATDFREVPVAREIDEARLPAVVVAVIPGVRAEALLLDRDLRRQMTPGGGVQKQCVLRVRRRVGQRGERVQRVDEPRNRSDAIERAPRPRSVEIAPLREVPRRAAKAIDRRLLARD